jgi:hypothetical protein
MVHFPSVSQLTTIQAKGQAKGIHGVAVVFVAFCNGGVAGAESPLM